MTSDIGYPSDMHVHILYDNRLQGGVRWYSETGAMESVLVVPRRMIYLIIPARLASVTHQHCAGISA